MSTCLFTVHREKISRVIFCCLLMIGLPPNVIAHGDDAPRRATPLTLHISAIPNPLQTNHQQSLHLSHAYLSVFSVQFLPCRPSENSVQHNTTKWLDWFISSAHANHGVAFSQPTHIPIRTQVDLLKDNTISITHAVLPPGQYCHINLTFAHAGANALPSPIQDIGRYSLYVSGKIRGKRPLSLSATYAYGENIPINLSIPTAHQRDNIHLSIQATTALSTLDLTQSPHMMARHVLLTLPKQLRLHTSN